VTLDTASAVDTADWYKGSILVITGGPGAGQCRLITAYAANRRATLARAFVATLPTAASTYIVIPGPDVWNDVQVELTTTPAAGGTFALKLQALYQRFFFKRTQTSALQQLYTFNETTPLMEADVADNGTTQSISVTANV
jgi:predicted ATPase